MEEPVVVNKGEETLDLPPGFRFHPTDEEIITFYLTEKVMNSSFSATAMGEVDLNKCEPWDLPKKAKMGEKEWFFFCQRDRKYPTGMRTNRATESGYWKATGKDKEIFKGKGNLVGMKKTLVFYRGRAPKGEKTNWVMHEFRLEGKFSYNLPKAAKDEWVVSRVFHKNTDIKNTPIPGLLRVNSQSDDLLDCSTLPPLMDPHPPNYSDDDFKGITNPTSSDGYFLPSFSINNSQLLIKNSNRNFEMPQHPTTCNYNQVNLMGNSNVPQQQIQVQNPSFSRSFHNNAVFSSDYMHQDQGVALAGGSCFEDNINHEALIRAFAAKNEFNMHGLEKQCKVEQFSGNQSAVVSASQDTGVSNDRNTADISSAVSKQQQVGANRSLYQEFDGPSSLAPLSDFDGCLWDDYS
ncbi:hypothetical protein L6164_004843 [Bauhinia variegata]|uniref:Uncharacterized protein n=1 Tax=Bauhinia variegata TaxID=167791 RepID=A0ACB9PNJ8_BAUVA|nr:hypothetical protein L6164_004843 [Bauhinia variegata]